MSPSSCDQEQGSVSAGRKTGRGGPPSSAQCVELHRTPWILSRHLTRPNRPHAEDENSFRPPCHRNTIDFRIGRGHYRGQGSRRTDRPGDRPSATRRSLRERRAVATPAVAWLVQLLRALVGYEGPAANLHRNDARKSPYRSKGFSCSESLQIPMRHDRAALAFGPKLRIIYRLFLREFLKAEENANAEICSRKGRRVARNHYSSQ